MRCCSEPSNDGRGTGGGAAASVVHWEADLAEQGDVVFADGPQDIVGLDGTVLEWTIANSDRAQSGSIANWGFEEGIGLNWLASLVSGSWVPGTQTASRLVIPTDDILVAFNLDFTARIIVELFFTLATWSTGNPDIGIGFAGVASTPNNSGNRMFVTKRGLRAGTDVSLTETTAASSNYTTPPGPTADVIATMMLGNSFVGLIGNATPGPPFVWPPLRTIVAAGSSSTGASVSSLSGTVLAMSFASVSTAGTSRLRANRIRIRSAA